jgi:hypothetical protein
VRAAAKLLLVAGILVASSRGLRAADGEPASPGTERPWAEGVPQAKQDEALLIYEEANKLFEDSQHAAALARYRAALEVWDHPAIHYNAAVALIYLDQPLAAYDQLEAALRYGTAPFNADTYQQALTYQKLLRGQLAELKVACPEPGAEVALDGRPLFVGPGEATRRLLPGPHQLVARKPVFLTETRTLSLLPGKPASETLRLQDIRTLPTKTVRRWPMWKPFTVVGAGLVVAAIGVPFYLDAKSSFDTYDKEVKRLCAGSQGCAQGTIETTSPWAIDARNRGSVENIVALSLFSVGAAAAATGLALAILNQPRVVPWGDAPRAQLLPVISPGTLGVSLALLR